MCALCSSRYKKKILYNNIALIVESKCFNKIAEVHFITIINIINIQSTRDFETFKNYCVRLFKIRLFNIDKKNRNKKKC